MNKEKIVYFAHLTVTAAGALLLLFVLFRYLALPLLPFLIAWSVAMITRPAAARISARLRLSARVVRAVLSCLAVLGGLALAVLFIILLLSEAWQALSAFLEGDRFAAIISSLADPIGALIGDVEGAEELRDYLGESVKGALSSLLGWIVDLLTSILRGVPSVLFFILVTVVATVYFAIDIERINSTVRAVLPRRACSFLSKVKRGSASLILGYLRSYLYLLLITFGIMLVGFVILGVENALLLAFVAAFLDLLPVIGVGTMLVPWSIYELIFGSRAYGIGLAVLFVVYQIIRQVIEPKIIGKSLGIHPLLSLVLLFVGYSVLGVLGLFLAPMLGAVISILFDKNNSPEVRERTVSE